MSKRNNIIKKIIIGAILIGAAVGGFYGYRYFYHARSGIIDFVEIRDTPFIIESFQRDWYWLIEGNDYDVAYMLANRASSKRPSHKGNFTIKVAYEDDKPVGFVIYMQKKFYHGHIRFIYVNPEFRSKGWSDKLLDYAVQDLIKRGSSKIDLTTRTSNSAAIKLYLRHGFKEVRRDDGFVDFEYEVMEKK